MDTHNIPQYRPAGSPLAERYGATASDGTPLDATARRVAKSLGTTPTPPAVRPAGTPLAVAYGPTDPDGRTQSLANLRRAFSPSSTRRRVTKAKSDPKVAVYDATGALLGAVDPEDLVTLSAGSPVGPSPSGATAKAAADPIAQAVEKARQRRSAARQKVAKAQAARSHPPVLRIVNYSRGRR